MHSSKAAEFVVIATDPFPHSIIAFLPEPA
jgi:hypothetical protein